MVSSGVLDDVTITQFSAVAELHGADPAPRPRQLRSAGIRIGRDHIASTVNTLVLAYTAAVLPLLLIFTQSGRGLGAVITSETVAVEVVQTLVGSIGLVASVPLTIALACWVIGAADDEATDGPWPDTHPDWRDPDPQDQWPLPTAQPPTRPTRPPNASGDPISSRWPRSQDPVVASWHDGGCIPGTWKSALV
jgi:hypothetical protein